jgi:GntP family gluconate:H+ symporter
MMAGGTILGLITITAGYFFARYADRKWPVQLRDSIDARLEDIQSLSSRTDSQLPSLGMALLPVVFPLVFICADNMLRSMQKAGKLQITSSFVQKVADVISLLGDKNIALIIGGLIALIVLARQKSFGKEGLTPFVQAALMSGGGIILITSAGGAFGGILQQTGISSRIGEMTKDYQMALIPMAFVISAIVRTAQGSATVALITASGILSGLATSNHLEFHPLYLGLAIGCGSKVVPWMNDAGFWIIVKISNLTEREALKTFSPMLVIMGTFGLFVIMVAARFFPLI